jgi:hypothetical protein
MTAVEWLLEQLRDVKYNTLEKNGYSIALEKIHKQALEMEKEQIMNANIAGVNQGLYGYKNSEEYYKKTFKNNEMKQDTGLSKSDNIEPKEKAIDLVDKYLDLDFEIYFEDAKQCALIAVDELIKETGAKYWYNVKKEIEKL